jgi:hypothetical protein
MTYRTPILAMGWWVAVTWPVASLWAQTVVAPWVPASEFSWQWTRGTTQYRSTERNAVGTVTNEETGRLPQLALSGRWQQGAWFADTSASIARNDVTYQGFTQIGLPLRTRTALAIAQGGVHAGHRWVSAAQTHSQTSWQWSGGMERLHIDRNILPGLGSLPLREVLTTTRAVAGVAVAHRGSPQWVAGQSLTPSAKLGLDVLRGVQTHLDVDSFGLYDPITLHPANSTDWRVKLQAMLAVGPHLQFSLGLEHLSFRPGDSSLEVWNKAGVPAARVRYPGSRQSMQTLGAGVQWTFD